MKNKANSFFTVFFPLLFAVLLAGAIGFAMYFTNNLTADLSTFYVQYGSSEFRHNADNVTLETGVYHNFECKYILGFPSAETGERYFVKIMPNDTIENFDYKIDNKVVSFYPNDKLDFSKAFNVTKHTNSFTLLIPNEFSMQKALETANADKTVTDVPQVDLTTKDYFRLVVTSYSGKVVINIDFRLKGATNETSVT